MRRRKFIILMGAAAAWPLAASAQQPGKRPLIVCLIGGSKASTERFFGGFSQGMRELGYVEGRDYGFEVRYAEGDVNRIPVLTEEVLRLKPDVLVTGTMAGVLAAKKLTDSTPIVSEVLTDRRVRRSSESCSARRQCHRRAADGGGPANQTLGACGRDGS